MYQYFSLMVSAFWAPCKKLSLYRRTQRFSLKFSFRSSCLPPISNQSLHCEEQGRALACTYGQLTVSAPQVGKLCSSHRGCGGCGDSRPAMDVWAPGPSLCSFPARVGITQSSSRVFITEGSSHQAVLPRSYSSKLPGWSAPSTVPYEGQKWHANSQQQSQLGTAWHRVGPTDQCAGSSHFHQPVFWGRSTVGLPINLGLL